MTVIDAVALSNLGIKADPLQSTTFLAVCLWELGIEALASAVVL